MSKIVILIISVGILYMLVKNQLKHKKEDTKAIDTTNMAKDPVCGTYVEEGGEFRLKYCDKMYNFCSKECMDKFKAEKAKEA